MNNLSQKTVQCQKQCSVTARILRSLMSSKKRHSLLMVGCSMISWYYCLLYQLQAAEFWPEWVHHSTVTQVLTGYKAVKPSSPHRWHFLTIGGQWGKTAHSRWNKQFFDLCEISSSHYMKLHIETILQLQHNNMQCK